MLAFDCSYTLVPALLPFDELFHWYELFIESGSALKKLDLYSENHFTVQNRNQFECYKR